MFRPLYIVHLARCFLYNNNIYLGVVGLQWYQSRLRGYLCRPRKLHVEYRCLSSELLFFNSCCHMVAAVLKRFEGDCCCCCLPLRGAEESTSVCGRAHVKRARACGIARVKQAANKYKFKRIAREKSVEQRRRATI